MDERVTMKLYGYQSDKLADLILGYISDEVAPEEVYTRDDILAYVRANLNPEDVFSPGILHDWAFENGYRRME